MSEAIDDIAKAIERASDVLHNSREWEAEGVYAEYVVPALDRARAALALATQRAEAAEEERENVSSQLWDCMNEREALRVERDALRTVDDAMVGRFLRAYAECESERPQTFTHRMGVRAALDAALAVRP